MNGQLAEMQRQSGFSDRASVSNRAYLFITYDTPQAPDTAPQLGPNLGSNFGIAIHFSVHNFGQSPAFITAFESTCSQNGVIWLEATLLIRSALPMKYKQAQRLQSARDEHLQCQTLIKSG